MTDTDQAATGRRDRKKRQTRAALTAAALRLVAERGLEHVTVEEISEAADVSSRTFFNYFTCKDEALTDDPALDGTPVVARLATAPQEVPALQAVRLALDEAVDTMQADRELWRLRLAVIAQNPALLPRLMAGNIETERAMITTIAARLGVDPDHGHPALVTAVAGATFRTAMLRWAADDDSRPLRDFVDESFAAVAAGLPDPPHPA
ncbi:MULTISPECIES: TetR family transcriptional regulator [unclassified Micromonospora]|uniref:acyl-CoA-like ligand-binding transcription factor n=1 Tax=unclassified Micromonospora TaxID=2617518 RepID=UPI000EF45AEE|nr:MULTISPECIES: TetR family transcriptional regulator [unclassified Micromonospora]RLP88456.1 TetR family transcriptional regulator [Micromonospora sp. BL4]RLP93084.1 TetR family transcriptional regulator [Micromonospora sp. CV4]